MAVGALRILNKRIAPLSPLPETFKKMAFCNKLSGLLRQGVSQSSNVPMTSMLGSLRYMSTKLFVGGLSWGTDDKSLTQAFSIHGEVTEATVISDRETGRSRGFGFVSFSSEDSANEAIKEMDGKVRKNVVMHSVEC